MQNGISIIICCYNSGWIVSRCLEALKKQEVRKDLSWEIVLVDNNCTDDTVQKAIETMANTSIDLRIVEEKNPGLLNARKKGITVVKYAYTIFCDDDNLLCPSYITTMYSILSSDPKIGAVGGMGIPEYETEPDPRVLPYINYYAVGSQKSHKDWLYGAGLALRTEIVRDVYNKQTCYLTGRKGNLVLAGDDGELVKSVLLRDYHITSTDEVTFTHALKADRLTYDYYLSMSKGFVLTNPVMLVMDCVLQNRSFFSVVLNSIYDYLLYFFHIIAVWKTNNTEVKRNYRNLISSYNMWSYKQLYCIYREWKKIKNSYSDSLK